MGPIGALDRVATTCRPSLVRRTSRKCAIQIVLGLVVLAVVRHNSMPPLVDPTSSSIISTKDMDANHMQDDQASSLLQKEVSDHQPPISLPEQNTKSETSPEPQQEAQQQQVPNETRASNETLALLHQDKSLSVDHNKHTTNDPAAFAETQSPPTPLRCAINLHGAARSFATLALPTLVANLIRPNLHYNCDYFVHVHTVQQENSSRSGWGGVLDPDQVFLLREAVAQEYQRQQQQQNSSSSNDNSINNITVEFSNSTEEEILTTRAELIHKIRTVKDEKGIYVYHPHNPRDRLYNMETTINIVRMFHNLQAVWNLMEQHEQATGMRYDRVALVRLDAAYVTPLDVFSHNASTVVVPDFARHPVNDRLSYGPRDAILVMANRFDWIEYHVQHARNKNKNIGIHSEWMLEKTIFPVLRGRGYQVVAVDDICFLRTRPDDIYWVDDCRDSRTPRSEWMKDKFTVLTKVNDILKRNCTAVKMFRLNRQMQCKVAPEETGG